MTHPERIIIGPLVYTVTSEQADYLVEVVAGGQDCWGWHKPLTQQIVLDPKQHAGHLRVTLLHELLHACYHHTDPGLADEERSVRALAGPLLDVLRRNPELVAFLVASDEET